MSELKKQFQIVLYDKELLITTPTNRNEAFERELNLPLGKEIKIGWHDWIETDEKALNYYECCGVLILFGIEPPTFKELCKHLEISMSQQLPSSEQTLMGDFKADAS